MKRAVLISITFFLMTACTWASLVQTQTISYNEFLARGRSDHDGYAESDIEQYMEYIRKYPHYICCGIWSPSDVQERSSIWAFPKIREEHCLVRKNENESVTTLCKNLTYSPLEEMIWVAATRNDTLEAYQEFLSLFPHSEFALQAEENMEKYKSCEDPPF